MRRWPGVRLVLMVAGLEQVMAPCLSFPARHARMAAQTPSSEGAGVDAVC